MNTDKDTETRQGALKKGITPIRGGGSEYHKLLRIIYRPDEYWRKEVEKWKKRSVPVGLRQVIRVSRTAKKFVFAVPAI